EDECIDGVPDPRTTLHFGHERPLNGLERPVAASLRGQSSREPNHQRFPSNPIHRDSPKPQSPIHRPFNGRAPRQSPFILAPRKPVINLRVLLPSLPYPLNQLPLRACPAQERLSVSGRAPREPRREIFLPPGVARQVVELRSTRLELMDELPAPIAKTKKAQG